ncbi:MAG: hypothetical protein K9J12_16855 [Melioribacteraceae bacterium]|nr:hypothetical protein [Melioribacteraceae bacterium]MCF8263408.1 hypothetical protein [Melioribacteraceae bacterium]MCF8430406.1 hypothetical protein [Melioribacteraceae bacterium]
MNNLNEFITMTQNKLNEFGTSLEKIKKEASQMEKNGKIELKKFILDIEQKKNEIEYKLGELREKGESALDNMKDGINNSMETIGKSFQKVKTDLYK